MLLKDMLFLRFPLLKVCYLRFDRWHYRTTDPPECRYCPGQIPRDAVTLFGEERSKNRKKPKAILSKNKSCRDQLLLIKISILEKNKNMNGSIKSCIYLLGMNQ